MVSNVSNSHKVNKNLNSFIENLWLEFCNVSEYIFNEDVDTEQTIDVYSV